MRRFLGILFFLLIGSGAFAQANLVLNEFSQGQSGSVREYIELVVVGTRTCTDSTADIRNWIFDDHNGWYGGSSTGIATGHYRFTNSANWSQVPYGSIILLYNVDDKNQKITMANDPTDANHDYVYVVPINSSYIEQDNASPVSPSTPSFVYPTNNYGASTVWASMGLANSGDAIIIASPANLGTAFFSLVYGFTAGPGFQTPTVTTANVPGGNNCYLSDGQYSNSASWIIGTTGTADETPGAGNTAANIAWINAMRVQLPKPPVPVMTVTQPNCTTSTGTITVTSPTGAGYTYSINGTTFQTGTSFSGLAANTYTVTVKNSAGCTNTGTATVNAAPATPSAPAVTVTAPTCTVPTGSATVTSPTGAQYTYSINGVTYQSGTTFTGIAPGTFQVFVLSSSSPCPSIRTYSIPAAPAVPANPVFTVTQPTCTTPTGTISITSPVGAQYAYSIDGTTFQASPTFTGLAPNTYTITVQQSGDCTSTGTATINAAPAVPSTPSYVITQPTCTTPTGTITINFPTGPQYTYSINGTTFQASNVFGGLAPNTYTITVQQTGGCTSSVSDVVNPVPAPPSSPVFSITQPTCTTSTGTITVTSPTGQIYVYSIDGTTFQSSPVFTGLTPNTYTITVQAPGGCSSTGTAVVNPAPATPSAPVTTVTQPTCAIPTGTITVTSPTGAQYTYSINGTTFQASPTFTGLAPNTYTITVQQTGGCSSTGTATVNAAPATVPNPTAISSFSVCNTSTGSITVVSPIGAQYTYSIDGTTFQSGTVFTGLAPAIYTITVQQTGGCTSSSQIIVLAAAGPNSPVTTVTQPTCATPTGTITVTSPTGAQYTYSINGTTFQSSPVFSGLAMNTYTVTVMQTGGCTSTGTATVTAPPTNPIPPTMTVTQPTCTTPTGTITITSPIAPAALTYSIDGINFQSSPVFAGLAPNTYTITVKNTAGCTSTGTALVNPAPAAPATPTLTITQPTCTTPTGTINITSPTGAGFTYSIDGTTFQAGTSFSGLAPNTYTVTVRAGTAACSSTATAVVNAAPGSPAAATSTVTQPTCSSPTGSITITAPTGAQYTYSINGTAFQSSPVFTGLVPNTYTITVQQTGGCSSTATATITAAPGAPASPASTVTQPTCSAPTGTITITSPTGAQHTYSINGTTFQASPVFTGLAPNTYTITVQQTGGCSSTGTATVNAAPGTPSAPVVITPVIYCLNAPTVPLTATGSNLLWYTSLTGTGSSTAITPSSATAGTTTYYVTQTVGGCESVKAPINVTVISVTLPANTGNNNLCVKGNSTSVLSNPTPGGVWSSSNNAVATVTNTGTVTAVSQGTAIITYTVTAGSCSASSSTTVNIGDFKLNISASANNVSAGTVVTLNTSAAVPYLVTAWRPLSTFPNQTATSQTVTVNTSAQYYAVAQSAAGCIDTAKIIISVLTPQQDIYIPTAFTPNGNGQNDQFRVLGNTIKSVDLMIYNKWGENIFHSTDKNKGWDGNYKGKMQPIGGYVYMATVVMTDNSVVFRKGMVLLVR